jgi:hypothetical protein
LGKLPKPLNYYFVDLILYAHKRLGGTNNKSPTLL